MSAEDLAGLEAHVAAGEDSILQVVRKAHCRTGDFPLKNYLWQRQGPVKPAAHHVQMFDAATAEMLKFLFGDDAPPSAS